jgi:primosomal protein N'
MNTYILRCPQCKQRMNYQPRGELIGKKKKCVYCGKSFTVNRDCLEGKK